MMQPLPAGPVYGHSRRRLARRNTLVLPRASLDAVLALALAGDSPRPGSAPWLAHGALHLQPWPAGPGLLAGALQPGVVVQPAATSTPADAPDGVLVLALTATGDAPPATGAAWEQWMRHHASGFRLFTSALNPLLAVLWLRADGLAVAACRHTGELDTTGSDGLGTRAGGGRWCAFDHLSLPGSDMLELDLGAAPARVAAAPGRVEPATEAVADAGTAVAVTGRYSRQEGALGPQVHARLQSSRIAIIGVGRTGSSLAHSLARMGASLLVIDPDVMESHNLDGDLPTLFEGRPKAEAAGRFVRGLMRPGADFDARVLPVGSTVAGALLADADAVVTCVDNDAARLWANAWALALNKPLLDIATGLHPHGAEADLRLIPPGTGCLACVGGFAQGGEQLLRQLSSPLPPPTPPDFRRQRPGSLRSWGVMSAHMGLRMLEGLYAGRIATGLFRHLAETPEGSLQVHDQPHVSGAWRACPLCGRLLGKGTRAVHGARLREIAEQVARTAGV